VPPSAETWRGLLGLAAGSVLAANFLFFAAVKRIEAAPAAVAATIEPVSAPCSRSCSSANTSRLWA